MSFNFLAILVAAVVPTVIGFVWYNPKVLGTVWMNESGMTEEKMKGGNMPLIFGLSFVLSLLLALEMNFLVIHQLHIFSTLENVPDLMTEGTELNTWFTSFMAEYGTNFRTFKHGALHGLLSALFIVLPVLGTNAMFERKSFKLIALNVGYWAVCFTIMGGIISAWM